MIPVPCFISRISNAPGRMADPNRNVLLQEAYWKMRRKAMKNTGFDKAMFKKRSNL